MVFSKLVIVSLKCFIITIGELSAFNCSFLYFFFFDFTMACNFMAKLFFKLS